MCQSDAPVLCRSCDTRSTSSRTVIRGANSAVVAVPSDVWWIHGTQSEQPHQPLLHQPAVALRLFLCLLLRDVAFFLKMNQKILAGSCLVVLGCVMHDCTSVSASYQTRTVGWQCQSLSHTFLRQLFHNYVPFGIFQWIFSFGHYLLWALAWHRLFGCQSVALSWCAAHSLKWQTSPLFIKYWSRLSNFMFPCSLGLVDYYS